MADTEIRGIRLGQLRDVVGWSPVLQQGIATMQMSRKQPLNHIGGAAGSIHHVIRIQLVKEG